MIKPKPKIKKGGGILKNWFFDGQQLSGNILKDKLRRFKDGERIRTSLIRKITVETINSIYELDMDHL